MKKATRDDRIVSGGIVGLLFFAPLAFGAVRVWAYTVQALAGIEAPRWRQAFKRVWEYFPDDAVVLGIVP